MENDSKYVNKAAALSLLNDLHFHSIRNKGDVGFRVQRNSDIHHALSNDAVKFIHSFVLMARSEWFQKGYIEWRQTHDIKSSFENDKNNRSLLDFEVEYDQQIIWFTFSKIKLNVLHEFGK